MAKPSHKKTKTIALYGGSFNPPHDGHMNTIRLIHHNLELDEIWMIFSENRFKDPAVYPSIHHRMEMAALMLKAHKDLPVMLSTIEDDIGIHVTADLLKEIQKQYPDDRFIWVMGADNLASLHTWENADDIMQNFDVIVINRPGYEKAAATSPMARKYAPLKRCKDDFNVSAKHQKNGWLYLENTHSQSSSALLEDMRQGTRDFNGPFQDVADYIVTHKLYNITDENKNGGSKPNPPSL